MNPDRVKTLRLQTIAMLLLIALSMFFPALKAEAANLDVINAAMTEVAMREALQDEDTQPQDVQLNLTFYNTLTVTVKNAVAAEVLNKRPITGTYATTEAAITAFGVAVINQVAGSTYMRTALETHGPEIGLAMEPTDDYDSLTGLRKNAVANFVLTSRPSGGYSDETAVKNQFDAAVAVNKAATATDMANALYNYGSDVHLNLDNVQYNKFDDLSNEGKEAVGKVMLDERTSLLGYFNNRVAVSNAFNMVMSITPFQPLHLSPEANETGVKSEHSTDRLTQIEVTFAGEILFLGQGRDNIVVNASVPGRQTTDIYDSVNTEIGSSKLIIRFQGLLQPDSTYTVFIPAGTVDVAGIGGNSAISWTFYTERKPSYSLITFEPGSESIDPRTSPFGDAPTQYLIPELSGVSRIGVDTQQSMVINFVHPIEICVEDLSGRISIVGNPFHRPLIDAHIHPTDESQLVIKFITTDIYRYLNPSTIYTLNIPANVLQDQDGGGEYSKNEAIIVKFKTADGFKRTLLDGSVTSINQLFNNYGPRNIAIKVPKVYIEKVETVHRYQGLVPEGQIAPNLTNIDIYADDDVEYIRIETNRGIRDNLRRADGRFTAGFAGLSADVSNITIYAYDEYYKLLEHKSFKLGATGNGTDYIKNNYIPPISAHFGRDFPLYDFMYDPVILEQILKHVPVSQLDRLGLFYPFYSPYTNVNQ